MNQNHAVPLADSPPVRLRDELAALAARLTRNVHSLSRSEKQLLADVQRTDGRCTFARLEHLAEIASRSPDAADREALPNVLRKRTSRRERELAGVSMVSLEEEETLDRAALDIAEHRLREQDRISRERLEQAAAAEINVCRRMIDALHAGAR